MSNVEHRGEAPDWAHMEQPPLSYPWIDEQLRRESGSTDAPMWANEEPSSDETPCSRMAGNGKTGFAHEGQRAEENQPSDEADSTRMAGDNPNSDEQTRRSENKNSSDEADSSKMNDEPFSAQGEQTEHRPDSEPIDEIIENYRSAIKKQEAQLADARVIRDAAIRNFDKVAIRLKTLQASFEALKQNLDNESAPAAQSPSDGSDGTENRSECYRDTNAGSTRNRIVSAALDLLSKRQMHRDEITQHCLAVGILEKQHNPLQYVSNILSQNKLFRRVVGKKGFWTLAEPQKEEDHT